MIAAGMLTRYWAVILLPAIALAVLGVALGAARNPQYTASSTLNVGRLDVTSQALPGFAQTAQNLSQIYSRLVLSNRVQDQTAVAAHVPLGTVQANVSATPIPTSSVFRIDATGRSAAEAKQLANGAATSTIAYIENLNRGSSNEARLLSAYRRVQQKVLSLRNEVGRLRGQQAAAGRPASGARIRSAQLQLDQYTLQAQGLAGSYQAAAQGGGNSAGLSLVTSATTSTSDRSSWIQRLGAAGAAAGLLVGLALAFMLARRRLWRGASASA